MARRGSEPVDQTVILENSNHGSDTINKLNEFRLENCLTDVVLIAGFEEFPCHKNVLAASSPYFRAMFSGDLRESTQSKININEVPPWTLRRIVDYAYSGRLEITVDNAEDLLAAGSLFQYEGIIDACCNFLSKHLHPSNCLRIEHFAHLHSCSKLETEAHQYALDNFSMVVEHEEFLEIPLQRLLTYLASDLIDVRNEECVYNAVMNWIRHDTDKRQTALPQILNHVRLSLINMDYLSDVILDNPIILNCETSSSLVKEALIHHSTKAESLPEKEPSMSLQAFTPRPSTVAREVVVIVGGITDTNSSSQSVEMYDSWKDRWFPLPDMPQSTSLFSVSALHNDIYVTGGITGNCITVPSVWKFESTKRVWTTSKPMLTPRARHASSAWESKIFVLGGMISINGKLGEVESIECYTLDTDQWTKVGYCPYPRKQSQLVPFNKTLVEVGGSKGDYPEDTMETFLLHGGDVVHSGEQFRLPEPIKYAQIVLLDSVFFIIWENSKKMILLDPSKRFYKYLAPMKYTHIHGGATVVDRKIYVAGGLIDNKPCHYVECYDPDTNCWSDVKSLPQSRACEGCVTVKMC